MRFKSVRSKPPAPAVSHRMSLIRSRDTKPELLVRKLLSADGVRYFLHRKDIPGRPDLYIPRMRTAIFVNGCFWHQHTCKLGARVPRTHRNYWIPKLTRNVERDAKNYRDLRRQRIKVVILWTCKQATFEKKCHEIASEYHRMR